MCSTWKLQKRRPHCNFFVYSTFHICQPACYKKVMGLLDSCCTQIIVCPQSLALTRISLRTELIQKANLLRDSRLYCITEIIVEKVLRDVPCRFMSLHCWQRIYLKFIMAINGCVRDECMVLCAS